jgi:predicted amidohydrolase
VDQRGSFTEFIKTPDRVQVSVNISKPGITKGNHWHHTKNEKLDEIRHMFRLTENKHSGVLDEVAATIEAGTQKAILY